MNSVPTCADLPEKSLIEWVMEAALTYPPQVTIPSLLQGIQLEALVLSLLDLNHDEAAQIDALAPLPLAFARSPEQFHEMVQEVILRMRLSKLFTRTDAREFHWAIHPAAYDPHTGKHHPIEMAIWRANFRDMAPERQMMAATLVWMYRGASDSIWLRRVPCTWKASEALNYLHDADCLRLWLQLVVRYPGW